MEDLLFSKDLGLSDSKYSFIDLLECEILNFHYNMLNDSSLYYDENYLTYVDCLKLVHPKSKVLGKKIGEDLEGTELDSEIMDYWLVQEPYTSTGVARHISDFYIKELKDSLSYDYSLELSAVTNIVGIEFRAVYNEGNLLSARLVGATGLGVDITEQMFTLLGEYKESLVDLDLCEIRGTITLATNNTDMKTIMKEINEKLFNYTYKSDLLRLIVLVDNILSEKTYDMCLDSRLSVLNKNYGFRVPLHMTSELSKYSYDSDLDNCILNMDLLVTDYSLPISGVRVYNNSTCEVICNLELGRWKPFSYESEIADIEWINDSIDGVLHPYALLTDAVKTKSGVDITKVPLYAPANILILEAYKGNPIHFRYGKKVGAIPVTKDNRLLLSMDICI